MAIFLPGAELPDNLTADETRVIEDARTGHVIIFDPPEDAEDPASWRMVRAAVLFALLLHHPRQPLAPKGLCLQHACIIGSLDFSHVRLAVPLQLESCLFLEKVVFADASCPALSFPHCTFKNGFDAPRSRIDNTLNLIHTTIIGQLNLENTFIRVDLDLEEATLSLSQDPLDVPLPVLNANSTQIGSSLHLTKGFQADGTVSLSGARIGGQLSCRAGIFRRPNGIALNAQSIEVSGGMFLDGGFVAEGTVWLSGARIGGQLGFRAGIFRKPGGTALHAENIETSESMFLDGGFVAEGAVVLAGAEIGGQLNCSGGKFCKPEGIALNAEHVEVSGDVFLDGGFVAEGMVWLSGAKIGGQLNCSGGKFCKPESIALNAEHVETSGDVFLDGEFVAEGTVRLSGAKIDGQFICRGARLRNPGGAALDAQSIEASGGMFLDGGFVADGRVVLAGAKIGGQLGCRGGTFRNPGGAALNAENIETGESMFLDGGFTAEGAVVLDSARISGQLDLRGGIFEDELVLAHAVARKLVDDKKSWSKQGLLFLDGFKYEELAYDSLLGWKERREWLERQKDFVPGPYEQLAKVYRARGEARAARKVLITKYTRQIRSLNLSPVRLGPVKVSAVWRRRLSPVLFFRRSLGVLVGYGHEPWRAGGFLALLILLAWGTFTFAAGEKRMAPVEEPHNSDAFPGRESARADECTFGMAYPCFHGFVYAVDVAVPFVDLEQRSFWAPVGGYRWVLWGVVVAGWLLVSAVAVGLTLLFRE